MLLQAGVPMQSGGLRGKVIAYRLRHSHGGTGLGCDHSPRSAIRAARHMLAGFVVHALRRRLLVRVLAIPPRQAPRKLHRAYVHNIAPWAFRGPRVQRANLPPIAVDLVTRGGHFPALYQPLQLLARSTTERLSALPCVDPREADAVLNFLCVEQRDGIAVGD